MITVIFLALFLHLLHKKYMCLLHFSIFIQGLVGHNSVGSKTKMLRPRPKLQDQDQDQGRSETGLVIKTAVSNPKTAP